MARQQEEKGSSLKTTRPTSEDVGEVEAGGDDAGEEK